MMLNSSTGDIYIHFKAFVSDFSQSLFTSASVWTAV